MFNLGLIHQDDDAFLQIVGLGENRIDEMKRCPKVCNFIKAKPDKNTLDHKTEIVKGNHKNTENRNKNNKEEIYE
jgi:hypothetical protein